MLCSQHSNRTYQSDKEYHKNIARLHWCRPCVDVDIYQYSNLMQQTFPDLF